MPHASDIGDPIADAAGFGAALKPSISSSANLVGGLLASVILFSDFFEGNAFGGASIVVAVMGDCPAVDLVVRLEVAQD